MRNVALPAGKAARLKKTLRSGGGAAGKTAAAGGLLLLLLLLLELCFFLSFLFLLCFCSFLPIVSTCKNNLPCL
jgi:hypothetical protein